MLREDFIHYVIRQHLRELSWSLLAGQYPNGSDDELRPLNVIDPTVARDQSPDPRRHSMNKLVPDLVAIRESVVLVIEMKPAYSAEDELKLDTLLGARREDFENAFERLSHASHVSLPPTSLLTFVPALGFSSDSPFIRRVDFGYFLVAEPVSVSYLGSDDLPSVD